MRTEESQSNILENGPSILFREGSDSLLQGDAHQALQQFRRVLRHSKRAGDQNAVGWSIVHVARVLRTQGQQSSVIRGLSKAQAMFEKLNNKIGLGAVYQELSLNNRDLTRYALALEYAREAMMMFKETKSIMELASVYNNISAIQYKMFKKEEALAYAKKARAIFMEFKSRIGLAWNSFHMANIYVDMEQSKEAEKQYEQAYKIFMRLKSRKGKGSARLGLSRVYRHQSLYKKAERAALWAEKIFQDLGMRELVARCLLQRAAIKRDLGKMKEAEALNKESLRLFRLKRDREGLVWGLYQKGQILGTALYQNQAKEMARQFGLKRFEARIQTHLI